MSLLRVFSGVLLALSPLPAVAQRAPVGEPPPETYTHIIVRGDTLIELSHVLLEPPHDWRPIARLNGVRNPRRLRPGRPLYFPVARMRSLPGHAQVVWVRGAPRVERPSGESLVALLGATLVPGDAVVTGQAEHVRLRLSTGSVVTIGEQARVSFVELRTLAAPGATRTRLDIDRGRIETTVPPATHPAQRDVIRTPLVMTTVRGTEFRVAVDQDASVATEVTEGAVGVSQETDQVSVAAGFGTRARAGAPLAVPRALLTAPTPRVGDTPMRQLPVRVAWEAVPGALAYRVRLGPDGEGPPVDDRRVAGPEASWPDLPDGAYRVTLRAIDDEGLEGLETTARLVVDARPVAPILQASTAPVTYGDRMALAWTRPEGVQAFDLQVATDEAFASTATGADGLSDTAHTVTLPPGRYVWRVASRDGEARGPWSTSATFELRPLPPAGPPPDAALAKKALTLRWAADADGGRYVVQMATDPAFTTMLVDQQVAEPTITVVRPPAGRYHVRVRLVNAEGVSGPFGPTQQLDIPRPPRSKWWWILLPLGAGALVAAF